MLGEEVLTTEEIDSLLAILNDKDEEDKLILAKSGSRRKMDLKTAISILENEKACVMRADKCNRDCAKCELVKPDNEILEALDMGIKAIRNGSLVDKIREFVKEENYLGKR